jgi:trk system potassium uptake protein TrkA
MDIVVAGEQGLAYFLARRLLDKGHRVTVIHSSREACVALARQLNESATVVHGDATDPRLLEEAGAGSADAVIVAMAADERNLAAAQQARLRFEVPRVLAVLNDPESEEVFRKLGVEGSFSLVRVIAALVEERASFDEITSLLPLGGGKVNLTEVRLAHDSPALQRKLMEIGLPPGCLIACVLRGGEPVVPSGDTVLEENDHLIVITVPDKHAQAMRLLVTGSP